MIVYAYPHHALYGRTPPRQWSVLSETGVHVLSKIVGDMHDIEDALGPDTNPDAYQQFGETIVFRIVSEPPVEAVRNLLKGTR